MFLQSVFQTFHSPFTNVISSARTLINQDVKCVDPCNENFSYPVKGIKYKSASLNKQNKSNYVSPKILCLCLK